MNLAKLLKYTVIVIAAFFLISQLISALYLPIKTETVDYYTATDGFKITGYTIRKETLVKTNEEGVLHFVTADGTRVAKKGVIANIYNSSSASVTVSKIDELKAQIADIADILSSNDIEAANLDIINSRIANKLEEMIFSGAGGNYGEMDVKAEELLSATNRRQAALGSTTGLSQRLSALKSELGELTNSLPSVKGKIRAKESGYFVSKTDGYEGVFTTENLDLITPKYIQSAKPENQKGNVIGKIVSDYEWYIAAVVSVDDSLKYKEGQKLKLLTSVEQSPSLPVTVKKINISENDDKAVIIFSCNDMSSALASLRSAAMTVVNKEYSGLKVPQKALRVVDSVRGVYVQNGMQVNFVPIEIIYSNDDYMICKKDSENSNYLKLYDKVVVKGKNLYDGKIIG